MDTMKYPEFQHMHLPQHSEIEDIPRLIFNINDAPRDLPRTNAKRLRRACSIASVLIREEVPVPPLSNPLTRISHHRIQLNFDETPDKTVELFVRDTDLYLLGFRRGVLVGNVVVWGTLFVFGDLYDEAPSFLHPVRMGISSSHSGIGGFPNQRALAAMFHTFAGYEERVQIVTDEDGSRRVRDLDEGTLKDLRSAITSAILVFCEALRFKSICSEAFRCLRSETYLTPISKRLQDLIHSSGTFSILVLERRKENDQYRLIGKLPNKPQYGNQKLIKLNDLIGSKGELKFCKMQLQYVIDHDRLKELEAVYAATNHPPDPGFQRHRGGGGRGRGRGGRGGRGRGEGRGGGRGRGEGQAAGGQRGGRGRGEGQAAGGQRGGRGRGRVGRGQRRGGPWR